MVVVVQMVLVKQVVGSAGAAFAERMGGGNLRFQSQEMGDVYR
jgi:hypothetical protein